MIRKLQLLMIASLLVLSQANIFTRIENEIKYEYHHLIEYEYHHLLQQDITTGDGEETSATLQFTTISNGGIVNGGSLQNEQGDNSVVFIGDVLGSNYELTLDQDFRFGWICFGYIAEEGKQQIDISPNYPYYDQSVATCIGDYEIYNQKGGDKYCLGLMPTTQGSTYQVISYSNYIRIQSGDFQCSFERFDDAQTLYPFIEIEGKKSVTVNPTHEEVPSQTFVPRSDLSKEEQQYIADREAEDQVPESWEIQSEQGLQQPVDNTSDTPFLEQVLEEGGSEEDIVVDGEAASANLDDFLNDDGENYYDLNTTPIITRNVEQEFTENDRQRPSRDTYESPSPTPPPVQTYIPQQTLAQDSAQDLVFETPIPIEYEIEKTPEIIVENPSKPLGNPDVTDIVENQSVQPEGECAIIYEECNFQGPYVLICDLHPNLNRLFNVKSVYVPEGKTLHLFQEVDFQSQKSTYYETNACIGTDARSQSTNMMMTESMTLTNNKKKKSKAHKLRRNK